MGAANEESDITQKSLLGIIEKHYRFKQAVAHPVLGRFNIYQNLNDRDESHLIAEFHLRGLQLHQQANIIEQVKSKKHRSKNFLKVICYKAESTEEFCILEGRINLFTEYYTVSLKSLMLHAKESRTLLPSSNVRSLIKVLTDCALELLAQKRFFTHLTPEHIFYNGLVFKVFQSFNTWTFSKYFQRNSYIQPNLAQCYATNKTQVVGLNPFSVSVWSIGIVVLEATTFCELDSLYKNKMLDETFLEKEIDRAGEKYGQRVSSFLKQTLNPCIVSRIELNNLKTLVSILFG